MDTIQVEIFGQKYNLKGDGDAGYVRGLAALVDARMKEVQKGTGTADGYRIAILAALSLANDFLRLRSDHEFLRRTAEGSLVRLVDMIDEKPVP